MRFSPRAPGMLAGPQGPALAVAQHESAEGWGSFDALPARVPDRTPQELNRHLNSHLPHNHHRPSASVNVPERTHLHHHRTSFPRSYDRGYICAALRALDLSLPMAGRRRRSAAPRLNSHSYSLSASSSFPNSRRSDAKFPRTVTVLGWSCPSDSSKIASARRISGSASSSRFVSCSNRARLLRLAFSQRRVDVSGPGQVLARQDSPRSARRIIGSASPSRFVAFSNGPGC